MTSKRFKKKVIKKLELDDDFYNEIFELLTEDCPNYSDCGQNYLENYEPDFP